MTDVLEEAGVAARQPRDRLVPLINTPLEYAWGAPGGVSRVMGWESAGRPEAELWLGAHPSSPTRSAPNAGVPWRDLAEWEETSLTRLPFLMKVLSAASPLSLQAHPTLSQARAGYEREEALGIPRSAPERNYKDPNAKPELIVAIEDGFEALCGFRPVRETLDVLAGLGVHHPAIGHWCELLSGADGVRTAVRWLLSGEDDVAELLGTIATGENELIARLVTDHPDDPGALVALMLNRVVLGSGEALWLPAGNIHAYLRGTGVELMGPSDNVLRGGLTTKHIDREELEAVLDFTPGEVHRLQPVRLGPNVVTYRPASVASGADVDFELLLITGDTIFHTESSAIALVVDGDFELATAGSSTRTPRGSIHLLPTAKAVAAVGNGRLFVATAFGERVTPL